MIMVHFGGHPRRGSLNPPPALRQEVLWYQERPTQLPHVAAHQVDQGAFQQIWDYNSLAWAAKFLDDWRRQTMRSRIEPMKKAARSLRTRRELIHNYFRAQNCSPAAASRLSPTRPKSP